MDRSYLSYEPFEICSIRPPTENFSVTFRLTRNCYWNKCGFCPVYKFGARFSRRSFEEVKADIKRAKALCDLLDEEKIIFDDGLQTISYHSAYQRAGELIRRIDASRQNACGNETTNSPGSAVTDDNEQLEWFFQWFKETPAIGDSINHLLNWRLNGSATCFLGDADSLILQPDFIAGVIDEIKKHFFSLNRFTVYGRTHSASRTRSLSELKAFKEAGLDRIHFGLESGSDDVLHYVQKGETKSDHINGCLKAKEAGLSCSVYVMPGLGGRKWSVMHAHETAEVLTKISPDYIRIRSFQIFPKTPIEKDRQNGKFIEASEEEMIKEIRILVSEVDTETMLLSDSASNLLNINGKLPEAREQMLKTIDDYLKLTPDQKCLFSLESRLRAFEGQYGGLSEDIYNGLRPYINSGRLDLSVIPAEKARNLTTLIRSKLMP